MTFDTPQERQKFILDSEGLVHAAVNKLNLGRYMQNDAIAEGMIALIRSVDTYKPNDDVPFARYASSAISRHVRKCRDKSLSIFSVGGHTLNKIAKYKAGLALSDADSRSARLAEMATNARNAIGTEGLVSIAVGPERDHDLRMVDAIPSAMRVLPPRLRDIVGRWYGLDGQDRATLRVIGKTYGLTGEMMGKDLKKAYAIMRTILEDVA